MRVPLHIISNTYLYIHKHLKNRNQKWKYQNKGDNNWHRTSNNYACWHNIHLFFFCLLVLLFLSCTISGSIGPASRFLRGQLNRSCMSVHFVSMCFSLCFKHLTTSWTCVCTLASPKLQHADWASEGREIPFTKTSLSTATNKDLFRGIFNYVTVVYLLFNVIKRLCRCILKWKTLYTPESDATCLDLVYFI